MKAYLYDIWEFLKSSFWFFPGIIILLFILISLASLNIDENLKNTALAKKYSMWHGGAEGAQQILSTIAGSLITLMSIVFSVVTIPLSLTSSQYGSRIIRRFMQDPGTQIVLGFLTGTSIYCIMTLRTIQAEPEPFIPYISITISLIFTILSLGMLIYFIHHVSTSIQSPEIISKIAKDLMTAIKEPFPGQILSQEEEQQVLQQEKSIWDTRKRYKIMSPESGYVQMIDYDKLFQIAKDNDLVLDIPYRSSNFIKQDRPLIFIYSNQPLSPKLKKAIQKAFIIGRHRVQVQDIEYSLEQLVTISVRAMTEDARDNFTVNFCIDYLGDALCRLCEKGIPSNYYLDQEGNIRLIIKQITFHGLVDSAFNQIRQFGKDNPTVIIHLFDTIATIIPCTQTERQREVFKRHILMIKRVAEEFPEAEDKKDVKDRLEVINKELSKFNDSIEIAI